MGEAFEVSSESPGVTRLLGGSLSDPGSHVLVDKDRVSVGVDGDEVRRARGVLVRLLVQLHAGRLQPTLQLAGVGEGLQGPGVAVPAGVGR